jgi:hypothetical protein
MITAADLDRMRFAQLRGVLAAGHPLDPAGLAETVYEGVNLARPRLITKVSWVRFEKVFHRDRASGRLRGWNVGVEGRLRGEAYGHYHVRPLRRGDSPLAAPAGALTLDYTAGGNRRLDPLGAALDPLVQVNAGEPELLLGYTVLALGPLRVPTPLFFSLARGRPLTEIAVPPRG